MPHGAVSMGHLGACDANYPFDEPIRLWPGKWRKYNENLGGCLSGNFLGFRLLGNLVPKTVDVRDFLANFFGTGRGAIDRLSDNRADSMSVPKVGRPPLPTDIPLNCPYCGLKLVNVPSDSAQAFYECPKDGLLILPPNGRLRKAK